MGAASAGLRLDGSTRGMRLLSEGEDEIGGWPQDFMLYAPPWHPKASYYESKLLGEEEGSSKPAKLDGNPVSFISGRQGVEFSVQAQKTLCSEPGGPDKLKLIIASRRMTNPKQTTG